MFDDFGFRIRRKKEEDPGGGGGGKTTPDLLDQARRTLDKNRNATKVVARLLEDNHEQREQIRELQAQVAPKGAVILTGDDAKAWEKIKALGKPEDIEKAVKEHPDLLKFKTERETTDATRNVARMMDYDPEVLVDVTNARGLEYEVRSETVKDTNGKEEKRQVPHVRVKGQANAKFEPLGEFAKRELKAYEASLPAKKNGGQPPVSGVPLPTMASTEQGSGGNDMVAKHIERMNKAAQVPAPTK